MKPTDENINQALQKALKRRFDSFEVPPSSRLSSEILGTVKQANFSNFRRFSTILILIVLGSIGTLGVLEFWPEPGNNASTPSILAKADKGTFSIAKNPENNAKAELTDFTVKSTDRAPHILTNSRSEVFGLKQSHTLPTLSNSAQTKPFDPSRTAIKQPTRNPGIYPHPTSQNSAELALNTVNERIVVAQSEDPISIEAGNQPASTRLDLNIKKLHSHQAPTFRTISTPIPTISTQSPSVDAPQSTPSHWRGVVSFTPTNTYQRLTVLPQLDVQYQNFKLPSLFSVQTAGFYLRGGIEKKGFQLMVNYSRFTQRISYEIALDAYRVQPQGSSTYTIVREGESQLEEITFQLVGLSLQKKFFIPARPSFYVYTGASLNHDLTTSHNLAWGTLGIGKSWPVSPATSLSLIPQLGFGLNSVKTNNDAFKNRFYQLGLGVELTFGKN